MEEELFQIRLFSTGYCLPEYTTHRSQFYIKLSDKIGNLLVVDLNTENSSITSLGNP